MPVLSNCNLIPSQRHFRRHLPGARQRFRAESQPCICYPTLYLFTLESEHTVPLLTALWRNETETFHCANTQASARGCVQPVISAQQQCHVLQKCKSLQRLHFRAVRFQMRLYTCRFEELTFCRPPLYGIWFIYYCCSKHSVNLFRSWTVSNVSDSWVNVHGRRLD